MIDDSKAELAKWLLDTLRESQTFVLAQAPDVAQQIVLYGRIVNLVYIGATALLIWLYLRIWLPRIVLAWKDLDHMPHGLGGVLAGVGLAILGLGSIFGALPELIKAWFAPKLYLLDQVSQWLK